MIRSSAEKAIFKKKQYVDVYLASALRNDTQLPDCPDKTLILERSLYHGISALLASLPTFMRSIPIEIQETLRQQAITEAMWDLRHRQVLLPILNELSEIGVAAVILKGTALANSFYPSSSLRARGDTDLLVAKDDRSAVYAVLVKHGFARELDSVAGAPTGTFRQESWSYTASDSSVHSLDLHWEVMNAWRLSYLFDADVVRQSTQAIPKLSAKAMMMSTLDAVYHACIHRAVHIRTPYYAAGQVFTGGDRLIWLYDLHVMLPALTDTDWNELLQRCRMHETADICLDALTQANLHLGTIIPSEVIQALKQQYQNGVPMQFLTYESNAKIAFSNLRAIPSLKIKWHYLKHLLFPSKEYMRAKYPEMPNKPMALLYSRRLLDAVTRQAFSKSE